MSDKTCLCIIHSLTHILSPQRHYELMLTTTMWLPSLMWRCEWTHQIPSFSPLREQTVAVNCGVQLPNAWYITVNDSNDQLLNNKLVYGKIAEDMEEQNTMANSFQSWKCIPRAKGNAQFSPFYNKIKKIQGNKVWVNTKECNLVKRDAIIHFYGWRRPGICWWSDMKRH